MLGSFKLLDDILRGDATSPDQLENGRVKVPIRPLLTVATVLGIVFGVCIGSYSAMRAEGSYMQPLASGVKIPLLFGLTLLVTLPSLYVFNALMGSRLTVDSVLRLLLAMIGVALAVCASLGPIVVFFALSTESYPFMLILTVLASAVGGFLGLAFLLRTLQRLVVSQAQLPEEPALELDSSSESTPSSPDRAPDPTDEPFGPEDKAAPVSLGPNAERMLARSRQVPVASPLQATEKDRRASTVFRIWIVVFALVGAQMSWVLRPFVGSPDLQFQWFRERESNFFHAVVAALRSLFEG